ncbi:pilus assembly FimT family protein [Romboutsia sp. 1001713B170131_170501_G6]|uniref:pilus assembly FimT family protein n=1 Tax=Romboutsia sp. 1001713B170131_170501_G6 TaxID=2787108 RepID=UPI0018A9CC85
MTLVELVVCISIMILVSTLYFFYDNLDKYYINSFTKQLTADIRYVRRVNMLGDLSTYIYYDLNNKNKSYILKSQGEIKKEVSLPNETKIEYGESKIIFRTDGSPDRRGQTIRVYKGNIKKEITIVPISGRVLLKEGKYET